MLRVCEKRTAQKNGASIGSPRHETKQGLHNAQSDREDDDGRRSRLPTLVHEILAKP